MYDFTCNVCCAKCSLPSKEALGREEKNCLWCGSTVRFRWIVHALSTHLFGVSIPLKFFPIDKTIRGLGLSDWHVLADALTLRFSFRNTFLHSEPKFDLLRPTVADLAAYDFVIASEVFEHVAPPIQSAFDNLPRVLKPNGFVVFTVPWRPDGPTQEHFPDLHDWQIVDQDTTPRMLNRTRTGTLETFENLKFHGGDGQVIEMRFFSKQDLMDNLAKAGFTSVVFSRIEEKPEFGIEWEGNYSLGLIARKGTEHLFSWRWGTWKVRIHRLLWHFGFGQGKGI